MDKTTITTTKLHNNRIMFAQNKKKTNENKLAERRKGGKLYVCFFFGKFN